MAPIVDTATSTAVNTLTKILAQLRGLQWSHWNSHWKITGDASYSHHLLFERLYTSATEEIDTLGEKITSYYGPHVLTDLGTLVETTKFLTLYPGPDDGPTSLYERALKLELHLQKSLREGYRGLKTLDQMSLGLDDYLMSVANDHETNLYLLRQALR